MRFPMDPTERLTRLEDALVQQQQSTAALQEVLNKLLTQMTTSEPRAPSVPPPAVATADPMPSHIKPATPSEFDGDRSKGRAFLNSCNLYVNLRLSEFRDDQVRIFWTLSYMKTGRAATFADRVMRENRSDNPVFATWQAFEDAFKDEFFPEDERTDAKMVLESARYFQGRRKLDAYIDEFMELVIRSGYVDPSAIVLKFRRGLDPLLQDKIAESDSKPNDEDVKGWYAAARRLDRNRTANEAFRGTSALRRPLPPTPDVRPFVPVSTPKRFEFAANARTPVRPSPPPARPSPPPPKDLPQGILMDVDASKQAKPLNNACRHCGRVGHWQDKCPQRFDIRFMTLKEDGEYIQRMLGGKSGETFEKGFPQSDE